jgi:chromosome segregation ATPase
MEPQNAVELTEGLLTNAIFEMEELVDRLDVNAPGPVTKHPVLTDRIHDRLIDSFSDNESTWHARGTPQSSASHGTTQSLSHWELQNRLSTLSAHLNASKEEMKALLRANAALRDKNIILTKKTKESEEKYGTLKERLLVLRREIQRNRKSSDAAEKEHKSDVLPIRIEQTREKDCAIRALRQQIDKLTLNLGRSESSQQMQLEELEIARSSIEKLEKELNSVRDDNMNLRDSAEYLNSEIQYLHQEREDNSSRHLEVVDTFCGKNHTLSEELEKLSENLEKSQNDLEQQTKTNKLLMEKLRDSQLELYLSRKESSKQKIEMKELLKEKQAAQKSMSVGEDELNVLRNSVKVYIGRIRNQADKIRDLDDRIFEYEKRELVKAPVKIIARTKDRLESARTISPVETPSSSAHDNI